MINIIMDKFNNLFEKLKLKDNNITIDNRKLEKIVDGYETDIELENDVFKDEQDSILDSIQYYLKNKKKELLEMLNQEETETILKNFEKISI